MKTVKTPPRSISASSLIGDSVTNRQGEDLGKIEEVMLDTASGRIQYLVLSFGGFLGMGEKFFALPWSAFSFSMENEKQLILNVDKESLKKSHGFDKDNWPDISDVQWQEDVYLMYGYDPYWY